MVFWIFGYGSLVWNPGFEYDDKALGYIKNYRRVFDLVCIDHRGTPEHPARTCTLEEKEEAICWGMAYCVRGSPEKGKAAMAYLEQRECEYDKKTLVNFYKNEEDELPYLTGVIVFTSTPDKINNKYYLGPAPLEDMATQIATAFGHEDDTIIELANEVRKVLASLGLAVPKDMRSIGSVHLANSPLSPRKLVHLPEAIAMDS